MLDSLRLPEEKEHYDKLRNWLAVDAILELMANCGCAGNRGTSPSLPANGPLTTPIGRSFGQIRALLDEVVATLKMTQWEIAFFLTADPAPLARSRVEINGGGEQAEIFLSTGLVELLTEDELKAVVAHELAHIFFGHHRITLCCDWLDLHAKQGRLFALANMYHYWRHLAEISADLASLQVTTSPRSAITSLARQNLRTLAPTIDMDLFLREQKRRLEDGTLLQARCASHPPWEFRAIILDHCARQPATELCAISGWTEMLKVSPNDAYQFLEFGFLLVAGTYLIRADGAVHTAEINRLCDILARLLHAPEPQLLCLENQSDCRQPMQELGQELALLYPAKVEGIYTLLCSLVVQDGRIVSPEKEALADIAAALQIPLKTASRLLLEIIRQDFHPVMPSIVPV